MNDVDGFTTSYLTLTTYVLLYVIERRSNMSKETQKNSLWADELKKGWGPMLKDRLNFQGGVVLDHVAEHTATSKQTVKKHFQRLVDAGEAKWFRTHGLVGIAAPNQFVG